MMRRPRSFRAVVAGSMALAVCLPVCLAAGCAGKSDASQQGRPSPGSRRTPSATARLDHAPKITPLPGPVQPRNASFEGGSYHHGCPDTWTCAHAGKAGSRVTSEEHTAGKRSVRVDVAGASSRFVMRTAFVPAQPQQTYTADIQVRSSATAASGAESMRLRFYDAQHRSVGSGNSFSAKASPGTWTRMKADAPAPRRTAYVGIEVTVNGPTRAVWLDDVRLRRAPILEVWGDTGVRHEDDHDTLTMQFITPSPAGVHVGRIDAFGDELRVVDERRLVATPDGSGSGSGGGKGSQAGSIQAYALKGPAKFDPATGTILLTPGGPATITITGRFRPPGGTSFPRVTVRDPVAAASFAVYVAMRDYVSADSENRAIAVPDRVETQRMVQRLSAYLDTRTTKDGGWKISHPFWPTQPREDPQAIAVLTQGYLQLMRASDDTSYVSRSRRGLDWLLAHQKADGSFGLPWAFGSAQGHFPSEAHYGGHGRHAHPAGDTLAVVTLAGGNALLQGYATFGDARYLAGAKRVMAYLLHNKNGFQWLDSGHTRGSIPYCTLAPVFAPSDPRVKAHTDVVRRLRDTSIEVFNIDGAMLSFVRAFYQETGESNLLVYGDAIATNIARHIRADGSIPYAWYEPSPHSTDYAAIAYRGLLEYSQLRDNGDWRDAASRGYLWIANNGRGGVLPADEYAAVYGLDMSVDVASFVQKSAAEQKPDGSFSGGTRTRQDAVMFGLLAAMLVQMG